MKGSSKPSILLASTSIILHKADILPVFPAYAPILPLPLPPKLPWASTIPGEPTIGETRESRLSIRRGLGAGGGSEGGEVWMKATRKGSAFGPGDSVPVFVQLGWGGDVPIRVGSFFFRISTELIADSPCYLRIAHSTRFRPEGTNHVSLPFAQQSCLPHSFTSSHDLDLHCECERLYRSRQPYFFRCALQG